MKSPQSVSVKKRRDPGETGKKSTADSNGENGAVAPVGLLGGENKPKDKDEIVLLREQIEELQKTLLEKEEALKSAESLVGEMNTLYSTVDELRRQVADKEGLIKSINSQLHNAKVSQQPTCHYIVIFSICELVPSFSRCLSNNSSNLLLCVEHYLVCLYYHIAAAHHA